MDNFGHIYLYVLPNTPLQGREKQILGVDELASVELWEGLALTLTFDVVSDLVDLVKDVAVAVY